MLFMNLLEKIANKCMQKSHKGKSDGNMELWTFIILQKFSDYTVTFKVNFLHFI
jgi:hypothetical protein